MRVYYKRTNSDRIDYKYIPMDTGRVVLAGCDVVTRLGCATVTVTVEKRLWRKSRMAARILRRSSKSKLSSNWNTQKKQCSVLSAQVSNSNLNEK